MNEFLKVLSSTGATQNTLGLAKNNIILALLSIFFMEIVHFLQRKYKMRELIANSKIFYRWLFY